MSAETNMRPAMSMGRCGLALGKGYAAKGAGAILGLSLGMAVLVIAAAGGALLLAGIASLVTSDEKKPKAEQDSLHQPRRLA